MQALRGAVERGPANAEAWSRLGWTGLGMAYRATGNSAAARESYARAIELGADAHGPLAGTLVVLGELERARAVNAEGIRRHAASNDTGQLYLLYEQLERIATRQGDSATLSFVTQKAKEYARETPPRFAFNLGSSMAVTPQDE